MKNLFCSLLTLCSFTLLAQENTYTFNQKLVYDFNVSDELSAMYPIDDVLENKLSIYIGNESLLGHSDNDFLFEGFNSSAFLITKDHYYDVKLNSLENQISIKTPTIYDYSELKDYKPYNELYFSNTNKLINLNRTEKVNGYTCNNYELIESNTESVKTIYCIDEKNAINNASFLLPKQSIKGLIVKIGDSNNSSSLILNRIEQSNLKVHFDEKKSIKEYEDKIVKLKELYKSLYDTDTISQADELPYQYESDNRYEDPLYNYFTIPTSENDKVNTFFNSMAPLALTVITLDVDYDGDYDFDRAKAIKTSEESTRKTIQSYKKNGLITKDEAKELNKYFKQYFDQAKSFKFEKYTETLQNNEVTSDTIDAAVYALDETLDYQTNYKNTSLKDVQLAIDEEDSKLYLNIAPSHCKDLKNRIPDFSNIDLKAIVYNYTGQICDLYIYQTGVVDLTSTVDAIRKSVWELNKNYDSYKKEDKEKLIKFFDSLD
ncbi:hypothetical protein [Faecalibacter bovis]|uniref:Uncharacterized protein n=1 Tax=Faecalibacter bovis TaxID=2898187 RepID=A0ABX7XE51_9FLAO|nr:hypothetical protein [Faecalibacter bovis]QTV06157.1 hypothetical protein J9309_02100 [Faecalibacter bovis]